MFNVLSVDLDKQEQKLKQELREQLMAVTAQRNSLHNEVQLLQTKLSHLTDELKRSEEFQRSHANDESINKERISSLMSQVETMLAQEANESNLAITTIHEKMKQFRQRMTQEIQREKRFSATLNEELLRLKSLHNDTVNENRRLVEELSHVRDKLKHEQAKSGQLTIDLQEQASVISANKMKQFESENLIKNLEQKIAQFEQVKRQEMALLEEKIRLSADKENELQNLATEHKTSAYRIMYQNERDQLQNQLRHSYTFGSAPGAFTNASFLAASGVHDPTDLTTELSFKHAVESWTKEKSHLLQSHHDEVYALKQQHEVTVRGLQQKLNEAMHNVDKMRGMLMENQNTMSQQVTNVEGLQHRYNTQQQVLELTQKELRLLQQQHQHLLNSSVHHAEKSLNRSGVAAAGEKSGDVSHVSRSRASSSESANTNHSFENQSAHRHLHQSSIADRSYVSSASQNKAPSVSGSTRLPVPQNIFNKMLQGQTASPAAPQRSASPSVPARPPSPSPSQQQQLTHVQHQLQQAQSEIQHLQNALREAETRLSAEKKQMVMLKTTLQSQFEELLNNYRYLQTQFEANVTSSAAAAANYRTELERERSLRVEAEAAVHAVGGGGGSASHAGFVPSHAGLSTVSQFEDDSVFDLTTVTPRQAPPPSSSSASQGVEMSAHGAAHHEQETHYDHSHLVSEHSQHPVNQSHLHTSYVSIESATKHLEESLHHQMELTQIATNELSLERERTLNIKRRESKLFQLLIEVDNRYKLIIQELRTELRAIRNSVLDVGPFLTMETNKTLANLQIQLNLIFAHNKTLHDNETKAIRISLANAHEKEMRLLEERFVAQVSALNKSHASELDKMHAEIMSKAEKVVNGLNLDNATLTRIQSSGHLSGGSAHIPLPAFESVMKGLMEALESSEVVDGTSSNQIISLATAHNEPSFAASAAAKSLLIGHIDHFVAAVQQKVVTLTNSASFVSNGSVKDASLGANTLNHSVVSTVGGGGGGAGGGVGVNASFLSAQNHSFTSHGISSSNSSSSVGSLLPKY